MKKPENVNIEGTTYTVTMLMIDDSLDVFAWLTKRFATSLGKIVDQNMGGGQFSFAKLLDMKMADFKIGDMINELAMNVEAEELKKYARLMCECVLVNGQKVQYDSQFNGRPGHLFKLLFHVVRVNFSDFFSGGPAMDQMRAAQQPNVAEDTTRVN